MSTTNVRNSGLTLLDSSIASVKVAGEVWRNSGNLVASHKEALVACEDANEMRGKLMDLWTLDVDKEIPETGKNQKGEDIILRHDGSKKSFKKGQIKFRAYEVTANTAKGLSTIVGAIAAGGYDAVFPKGKLIGKSACEELAKANKEDEPSYKAIKRALTAIEQNITGLSDVTEVNELDALFGKVMLAYNTHTAPLKIAVAA